MSSVYTARTCSTTSRTTSQSHWYPTTLAGQRIRVANPCRQPTGMATDHNAMVWTGDVAIASWFAIAFRSINDHFGSARATFQITSAANLHLLKAICERVAKPLTVWRVGT